MSELKTFEQKVENTAVAVEEKVVETMKTVEEKVVKVVEKVFQELTSEEKLAIREIENSYLKAQIEINRLSQVTQKAQGDFTAKVESLTKKYVIDPATWEFNNVDLIFRKK